MDVDDIVTDSGRGRLLLAPLLGCCCWAEISVRLAHYCNQFPEVGRRRNVEGADGKEAQPHVAPHS